MAGQKAVEHGAQCDNCHVIDIFGCYGGYVIVIARLTVRNVLRECTVRVEAFITEVSWHTHSTATLVAGLPVCLRDHGLSRESSQQPALSGAQVIVPFYYTGLTSCLAEYVAGFLVLPSLARHELQCTSALIVQVSEHAFP